MKAVNIDRIPDLVNISTLRRAFTGVETPPKEMKNRQQSRPLFQVISRFESSTRDSLENIPHERDSLLEGASQDMTSQDTHNLLSGDTVSG